MKKTGQLLKEKREAAKLSISEVALATKINPKILNAIEAGNEAVLPAKTFLKGFLKSYALFLKMSPEEVLRSYQEETSPLPPPAPVVRPEPQMPSSDAVQMQTHVETQPAAQPQQQPQFVERRKGDRRRGRRMEDENSSGMRTAAVIVIVLLIGVIIGVRELIEKYQREKQVESTQVKVTPLEQPPVQAATEAKPAETASGTPTTPGSQPPAPAPQAAATAEPPAPAKPAQNEIMSPPPAQLPPPPAPLAAAAQQPAVMPTPPPKPSETKAADPKAALPPPPAPVPAATEKKEEKKEEKTVNNDPAKKAKVEIILEALDKVEVKFQIKGETKRVSLGPTQVHTIRADQPVTLDLSDGGAVNIFLNGRERGVPGDLGKPKTIKIP